MIYKKCLMYKIELDKLDQKLDQICSDQARFNQ